MGANKAIAGGLVSGFAGACAALITAIWWPEASGTITAAITTIIATPLTVAAIWFTPHGGTTP